MKRGDREAKRSQLSFRDMTVADPDQSGLDALLFAKPILTVVFIASHPTFNDGR